MDLINKLADRVRSGHTTTQLTVSDYSSIQRKKWVMDQYLSGGIPAIVRAEYKEMFKLSDASYDKDVTWSNNELRRKGENEIEAIVERHTDFYNHLYSLAVSKGDIRGAAVALKQLEDLYKLHKPSNTGSLNVQVNHISTLSGDDLYNKLNRDKPSMIISIDDADTSSEHD